MTKVESFCNLIKGRKPYAVGTVRNGRKKYADGTWKPVKKRKKYKKRQIRFVDSKEKKRYRSEIEHIFYYGFTNLIVSLKQRLDFIERSDYVPWHNVRDGDPSDHSRFREAFNRATMLGGKIKSGKSFSEKDVDAIDRIESMMSPLTKPEKVYRGIFDVDISKFNGIVKGVSLPVLYPTSTSREATLARHVSKGGGDSVFFELEVPEGTDCLVTNEEYLEIVLSSKYNIEVAEVVRSEKEIHIQGKVVKRKLQR